MSVIITNVSDHDGADEISAYTVRINNGPIIARFMHWRSDGLAKCLRIAADAVEATDSSNPFARRQSSEGER